VAQTPGTGCGTSLARETPLPSSPHCTGSLGPGTANRADERVIIETCIGSGGPLVKGKNKIKSGNKI